jgi:DNA-3-methyladenine glycosylase
MDPSRRLPREFYARNTLQVARELLGMRLVRWEAGQACGGTIIEAEAYRGEEDLACHAHFGRTRRNEVMYGPPGYAYIYFTYGMHWMLNFVTEAEGFPAAVLIRSIQPTLGVEKIAARRNSQPQERWTDGPAKLCQALNIDGKLHGIDLCAPEAEITVEAGDPIPETDVDITPRIGLFSVPEPWKSVPWRFRILKEKLRR